MREIRVGRIAAVLGQTRVIEPFDAVVVVLFSADKLVLVRNEQRPWDLPGIKRPLPAGPRPACRDGESRTRLERLLSGQVAACMKTCPADTTRGPRLEGVSCRAWSCMGRHRDGGWELGKSARGPRLEGVSCRAWSCMGRHRDGGWELYVQRRDWSAFQHRLFQAGAVHATPSQWLEYTLPPI
jgi:ketosteroid isomerase-like protein